MAKALRQEMDLTDGNLAAHLSTLEKAEYIEAKRQYEDRRPTTTYFITEKGREAFQWFLIGLAKRLSESSKAIGIAIGLSGN